jgi:hypothetical protein
MPVLTIGDYKVRTFEPPPRDFDPSTASDAKLLHHGFPLRPDPARSPRASRAWEQAMRLRREGRFTHVVPELQELPDYVHGPHKPVSNANPGTRNGSFNWSGAVLSVDPQVDRIASVFSNWTVPHAYSPNPGDGKTYFSSHWIGIDGASATAQDILQAGTETDVTGSGPPSCFAWWEWFPAVSIKISNLPFAPGDIASVFLCPTGPTSARVAIANGTSRQQVVLEVTGPAGFPLVGNSAEVIIERPQVNGQPTELPLYGESFFYLPTVNTQAAEYELANGTPVTMFSDDGSHAISTPELLGAGHMRIFDSSP